MASPLDLELDIETACPEDVAREIIRGGQSVADYVMDLLREHGFTRTVVAIDVHSDGEHCTCCGVELAEPNDYGYCGAC